MLVACPVKNMSTRWNPSNTMKSQKNAYEWGCLLWVNAFLVSVSIVNPWKHQRFSGVFRACKNENSRQKSVTEPLDRYVLPTWPLIMVYFFFSVFSSLNTESTLEGNKTRNYCRNNLSHNSEYSFPAKLGRPYASFDYFAESEGSTITG